MFKFLKQMVKYMLIVALFIGFGIYYINFRVDGQTSFTSEKVVVYADSNLNTKQYVLEPGYSFSALSTYTDSDAVKIRYSDEDGDNKVGFIKYDKCNSYVFPTNDLLPTKSNVIITVENEVDFTNFLKRFSNALQEYWIVGVYLEDSEYSENAADISYFCEQQGIPYGSISTFSNDEMNSYMEQKVRDSIENPDGNLSYEILPRVFDVTNVPSYMYSRFDSEEKEMLSSCIWKTSSPIKPSISIERYWMPSEMVENLSDSEIFLSTFDNKFGLEYSYVSSEFVDEVSERFYASQERLNR